MIRNFQIEKFRGLGVVALLVLAGCATPAPQVITRTVTVEVPVGVPCRTPQIDRPTWPLDVLPTDANDYEWARAALAEIEMRQGYESLLEAAVAACGSSAGLMG